MSNGVATADPLAGTDELVTLRGLTVRFRLSAGFLSRGKVDVLAVDNVSLAVKRGRSLGLVGATGSGKSTIAHAVMGMVKPTSGTVAIAGRDVGRADAPDQQRLRRVVQVVLQDPYSSLDPRMKVRDIVAEPLTMGRLAARGAARRAVDERVSEVLRLVGIRPDKSRLYPHEFSGGQRQRIAIARALAPQPELVVLDEPTSALDVSVRAQILILLRRLQQEVGVTYLVISHDLVTVAYLASEVAVMHLGRIIETGSTSALYRTPRHPYTVELLASVPAAAGNFLTQSRRLTTPRTDLADAACRYAPRCELREALGDPARCRDEAPALLAVGPDHRAACHFAERVVSPVPKTATG